MSFYKPHNKRINGLDWITDLHLELPWQYHHPFTYSFHCAPQIHTNLVNNFYSCCGYRQMSKWLYVYFTYSQKKLVVLLFYTLTIMLVYKDVSRPHYVRLLIFEDRWCYVMVVKVFSVQSGILSFCFSLNRMLMNWEQALPFWNKHKTMNAKFISHNSSLMIMVKFHVGRMNSHWY